MSRRSRPPQYAWNGFGVFVLVGSVLSWFLFGSIYGAIGTTYVAGAPVDWDFYNAFPTLLAYPEVNFKLYSQVVSV